MKLLINGDTIRLEDIPQLGAEDCQDFREQFYSALTPSCRHIQVDLSSTSYLDSCGLGALLSLHKTALQRNGTVRLLNPTPRVQLVFDVTRMNRVFEIVRRQ